MIEVLYYINRSGEAVIPTWLANLADRRAAARIAARIQRVSEGNFGDTRVLQQNVRELRVDYGPGYRVYYALVHRTCMILLCGGDKRRQAADITRAIEYWEDYLARTK